MSLILPQNKLKFNVERDIYEKVLIFELEKLHEKNLIFTSKDDILNFGILCKKRSKFIGQKRKMAYEIVKSFSHTVFSPLNTLGVYIYFFSLGWVSIGEGR